uniref:Dipeptidyl peptidase 3 n=1 Tax=Anolis carolinensis TaxID=28377 RepID=A0A803SN46_ANOCA
MVDSQYILPNDVGIAVLDCVEAFRLLSPEERLYAHYLSRACWYGGLVVLLQTSPEAPAIYALLSRLFRAQDPSHLGETARTLGLSEEEYQAFLVYAAAVYANMGNYKSFGDTKFVPNLPKEKLKQLVWKSQAFKDHPEEMEALWGRCGDLMFSLEPTQKHLGLSGQGISTYFSSNCSMEDAKRAQDFLDSQSISAYNTRLFKKEVDGKVSYEVRLASVCSDGESPLATISVPSTDSYIQHAYRQTAEVIQHFLILFSGHYARFWPEGELYIGFIESYRDPYGSRGEFEGFVAIVNKAMSAKFARLVSAAERLLEELPWPRAFEKDAFLKPDFTSLDVLTFAGSGIPAGINIPNYDDIRQTDGFKNVSLGNVLSVAYSTKKEKLTFLAEEDKDLYIKWKGPSFEVQVGLHELLGHGSGKLFVQDESGAFNFDREAVINPETGEQIRSWYRGGETWDSKFSSVASSYEECRAECVGLYLCLNKEVLGIFELEGKDADDVVYINWLNMVRAGVLALEFYTPESGSWRQAHMQARFVILRVLLEAGGGLVSLRHVTGEDGKPDAVVTLDRSKIAAVGKPALERFLRKLQVDGSPRVIQSTPILLCRKTPSNPSRQMAIQPLLKKLQRRRLQQEAYNTLEWEGPPRVIQSTPILLCRKTPSKPSHLAILPQLKKLL